MALRRWLLGAGVALTAAPATLCVGVAPARAEQPVVQATVYAAGQGAPRTVTVTDTELNRGCPGYGGSAPFALQPSDQPFQPATGSSWSLGTVVECGLNLPRAALNQVDVQSAIHGPERPLTPADLFDPTRYHDHTAPAPLPVVSLNGSSGQVTYDRPARGASDRNGADQVVATGQVTIAVYENAPPLTVRIVRSRLSSPAGTVRDRFTAQVIDPGGHLVPASSLSAGWTFGDGTSATTPDPAHSFSAAGRYFVTVTVADAAAGTGGTRTISVAVDAKALRGDRNQGGAGGSRKTKSRSGTVHGSGASPQGSPHARGQTVTNPSATPAPTATPAPSATPTPTPRAAPSPTPNPPAIATPAPAASPPVRPHPRPGRARTHRSRARRRTTPAATARRPATRLVTGQLVAALEPVPAASSPLARPAATVTPSAAVGAATHTTPVAGWAAAFVVAALLGAGAAGERRGRGRWGRLHLPPDRP